ncbi:MULTISPECIES: sensor histidine kinase [Paenibacillus]|uniref:sensor histidine kinase n=1 Tax=Paenibacillus TaxID=44249 RepID=UPI003009C9EF
MLKIKSTKLFHFTKIRSRFFAAMILLSIPAILLVGYISFNITKDTVTGMNEKSNRERLRTSSEIADLLFRNINNLHYSIVVNTAIREELRGENDSAIWPEEQHLRMSARLQRLISSSYSDTRYVKSICLLDLNFNTACSGRSDDMGKYESEEKIASIKASDWYLSVYSSKGKVVYYPKDIFGERNDAFSTIKLFRDSTDTSGEPIGILIVNVSTTIFDKIFGTGYYGSYMAIDANGGPTHKVYGSFSIGLEDKGGVDKVVEGLHHQGYLVNSLYNQSTDWTFLHLVRSKDLLKQSQNIRWITMAIAAGFAAIALALSYWISGTVTRPLLRLKKMMLDWTMGVKKFPESFDNDEVGVIGKTFRRVIYENDELNAKLIRSKLNEREAELRALQSQIKPHFLYNTLDSIYWMAILNDNDQVAQMAESLSESFKLSLNKGKETMLVYNELKHIEHYLRIQNIRFNNRFSYLQEVDETILGMEILKLLLQPLVENAIYHGLEPRVGEGIIRLTGVRDGQYLVFTVEDDGVGMEDISLMEQGYGVRNVKERLKLYYGESSSFHVWSRLGKGTRINLRFKPYIDPEKNRHAPK